MLTKEGDLFRVKVQGFEGVFTEISDLLQDYPAVVSFAKGAGQVLWSCEEATAGRISGDTRRLLTRTGVVGFKRDGGYYLACDDHPFNIIVTRCQEGYDANIQGQAWVLPATDPDIIAFLERAKMSDRIVAAPEMNPLRLSTRDVDGRSEYGHNVYVRALQGSQSEHYAMHLCNKKEESAKVYLLTSSDLERIIGNTNLVVVMPVGLGGGGCEDVGNVYADEGFGVGGRARGAVCDKKISALTNITGLHSADSSDYLKRISELEAQFLTAGRELEQAKSVFGAELEKLKGAHLAYLKRIRDEICAGSINSLLHELDGKIDPHNGNKIIPPPSDIDHITERFRRVEMD